MRETDSLYGPATKVLGTNGKVWCIRKRNGRWWIWKPYESVPVDYSFTFKHARAIVVEGIKHWHDPFICRCGHPGIGCYCGRR